jgi:hypothetical protein
VDILTAFYSSVVAGVVLSVTGLVEPGKLLSKSNFRLFWFVDWVKISAESCPLLAIPGL